MQEIMSRIVAVGLLLLVSFVLYWDLWKYEEPEDDGQEHQAREWEDEK